MGLVKRFVDVCRSNLTYLVERMEDPEKITNQTLVDIHRNIGEAKNELTNVIAERNMLNGNIKSVEQRIAKRDSDITTALKGGDEALAAELIEDKQAQEEKLASFAAERDKLNETIDELKPVVEELEKKYLELKHQRDILLAKSSSAKATERVYSTVSNIGRAGSDANATFERMSDRVDRRVAHAQASRELATQTKEQSLDERVKSHTSSSVSEELERRKAALTSQ